MEGAAALSIRRPQADGESLDPFRADRIFVFDERLTRQIGKTLAMLIRVREMQAPAPFASQTAGITAVSLTLGPHAAARR